MQLCVSVPVTFSTCTCSSAVKSAGPAEIIWRSLITHLAPSVCIPSTLSPAPPCRQCGVGRIVDAVSQDSISQALISAKTACGAAGGRCDRPRNMLASGTSLLHMFTQMTLLVGAELALLSCLLISLPSHPAHAWRMQAQRKGN